MKKTTILIILGIIITVGGIVGYRYYSGTSTEARYELDMVQKGTLIQEVSASGRVEPPTKVDLHFKNSGKLTVLSAKIGKKVTAGQLLAKIDAKNAEKLVHDAEIDLESAKLALAKLQLESSDENLNADLAKAYDDGFTSVSSAFLDLSAIINGLEDILNEDNLSGNWTRNNGSTADKYRNASEKLYYEALRVFKESRTTFRLLDRDASREEIEDIIDETYETAKLFSDAVKSVKNFVDYMADDSNDSANFTSSKNTLSEYTDTVSDHLENLLSVKTSIKDYKDAFSATDLDMKDALLAIRQKENALQDAKNELADYYIRAPFDGVVTQTNGEVGEIAVPDTVIVSLMPNGSLQIKVNISEADVVNVGVGQEARITLDAFDANTEWKGKVVSINPAETIIGGAVYYQTTVLFSKEDERVRSGMTANVWIKAAHKEDALFVPAKAIKEKEGKKFIEILAGNQSQEKEVKTGMRGTGGIIEILSGVNEGEKVIVGIKKQ